MARLVSLIVAVVTALAGHGLLFFGAFYLQRSLTGFRAFAIPGFVVPLAILGVLLIGISALTAAWSSLGVIVVGAVQTIVGLVGAFVPVRLGDGYARGWLDGTLLRLGPIGQTADTWLVFGLGVVEGLLLLALGWATARRRRALVARPVLARVMSLIVLFVALFGVTFLTLHGGYLNERRMFQLLAGPDLLGVVLFAVGAVLLVALMVTTRWSGLGAIVWGAVLALFSLTLGTFPALLPPSTAARVPNPLFSVVRVLPNDLAASILTNVAIGGVAVIGILFLFGGIASALAGRSGRRRATYLEPPTGEVPEVGPRWVRPESPGELPRPGV